MKKFYSLLTLLLLVKVGFCLNEQEPSNDKAKSATNITWDNKYNSTFKANDSDWYVFTASSDGVLEINYSGFFSKLAANVTLFEFNSNSMNNLVSADIDSAKNYFNFHIQKGKTYYILSKQKNGYNSTSAFALGFKLDKADINESNNTTQSASNIDLNASFKFKIWGNYLKNNKLVSDEDWFKISPKRDGNLNVSLAGLLPNNYVIEIYDSTNKKILNSLSNSKGNTDLSTSICATKNNTYFIRIYEKNGIQDSNLIRLKFEYNYPDLGKDILACKGQTILIGTKPVAGSKYTWTSNLKGFSATSSSFNYIANSNAVFEIKAIDSTLGCVLTDTLNVIINAHQKTWTGLVSSDWNNDSNWNPNCVPSKDDSVIIGNNSNQPIINSFAQANQLNLLNGAKITIKNNQTLELNGNLYLYNDTIVTELGSTLSFKGTSTQTIYGNTLNVYNMVVKNGKGLKNNAQLNIRGVLDPQAGIISTNDKLTIKSDSAGSGSIGIIYSYSGFNGKVEIEKHLINPKYGFVDVSSPIANINLKEWNKTVDMKGFNGVLYDKNPSVYSYDEGILGKSEKGYTPPSGLNQLLGKAIGWHINTFNKPIKLIQKGDIYSGKITIPLNYSKSIFGMSNDGFNLIGNPYPAPIDWNSTDINKTNMDGSVYCLNPINGRMSTYNGRIGVNGGSNILDVCQGFFVHANNSKSSIVLNEKIKSDLSAKQADNSNDKLIRVTMGDLFNNQDESAIALNDSATNGFDSQLDGYKLKGKKLNISSLTTSDSAALSINYLPISRDSLAIPLKTEVDSYGNYSLSFKIHPDIFKSSKVYLEDLFRSNFRLDLSKDSVYKFIIVRPSKELYRFQISVISLFTDITSDVIHNKIYKVYPNPVTGNQLKVNSKYSEKRTINIFDLNGRTISTQNFEASYQNQLDLNIPSGIYIMQVRTNGQVQNIRIVKE